MQGLVKIVRFYLSSPIEIPFESGPYPDRQIMNLVYNSQKGQHLSTNLHDSSLRSEANKTKNPIS